MGDRLGHAAWVVAVAQFFVLHAIVESAWPRRYSWAAHNISDLGNVTCGPQGRSEPRYVCSPEHALMNGSFVTLGVLFLVGVVLAGGLWRRGPAGLATRAALAATATGFALAGLAPADVDERLHVFGAALAMGVGNAALFLAGAGLADRVPTLWRRAALVAAAIGSTGCVLLLLGRDPGLGMGGTERVAAYPFLLWAFALGLAGLLGRLDRPTWPTPRPGGGEPPPRARRKKSDRRPRRVAERRRHGRRGHRSRCGAAGVGTPDGAVRAGPARPLHAVRPTAPTWANSPSPPRIQRWNAPRGACAVFAPPTTY